MGGRISNKVSPMKEYGRKPYLVTPTTVPLGEEADYRYMMDKTWQKAQDDAHIVVQSVKKKPYQEQDYQSMENTADGYTNIDWHFTWNWYRPKFSWKAGQNNTTTIIPPEDPDRQEERNVDGVLRWTQCPTTVSANKSYTVIVRNSYIITRQYTNGRLKNTQTETIPSQISIVPKTSAAKGLSITYVKDMGGSTMATLQTSSYATGEFYIYATDGKNTIQKTISATSKVSTIVFRKATSPYTYYKLEDLIGGVETPYTVFTSQANVFLKNERGSYAEDVTYSDLGSFIEVQSYAFYLSTSTEPIVANGSYIYQLLYNYYERPPSAAVSFESAVGMYVQPGTPLCWFSRWYQRNRNGDQSFYDVYNEKTAYFKYPSISLISLTTDLSMVGSQDSANANWNWTVTGLDICSFCLIDPESYVVALQYLSYTDSYISAPAPEYCPISGMFRGASFSFQLSWKPAVFFGSL